MELTTAPAAAAPSTPWPEVRAGGLLYANPLASADDCAGFVAEGSPQLAFPARALRLANALDPALGQAANFVLWCPLRFPADVLITWTFRPLVEPGLAMCWFAARGHHGRDLFDPALPPRHGDYRQYHSGAIDAYHISYFRRKNPGERSFHTCNLRKSCGFHLVAQGADPLPGVADADRAYALSLCVLAGRVRFAIEHLPVLDWTDAGRVGGARLDGGYFGLRQMAPLVAEYADLRVHHALPA